MSLDGHRVLVTGSSGFIGSILAEALLDHGVDVRGVDRRQNPWNETVDARTRRLDLTARDAIAALDPDVDGIVHLAAHSRVRATMREPRQAQANLEATVNLLEWAREHDVPRFLFASSREVYGSVSGTAGEDEADPRAVENPYAASKAGGEALVHAWGNAFGLDAAAARIANAYGRRDTHDRVIPIFVARAWEGRDLEVYGEGKTLDLLHVDDCVDGLVRFYERLPALAGESVNLGTGQATGLEELADAIVERAPEPVDVHRRPARGGEVSRFLADETLAREALDWDPTVDLEEGLDRTVAWYAKRPGIRRRVLDPDAGEPEDQAGEP